MTGCEGGEGRLVISEAVVRETVAEVAPVVTELTGWELDAAEMQVQVVPRERAYEQVVLKRMHGLGRWEEHAAATGLLERLGELLVERLIAAAYDHQSQTLVVVSTNVDDGNREGLRVIVGHELVHRGQARHHPDLFAQVDQAIGEALDGSGRGVRELLAEMQPTMKLIEGHAALVTARLLERYPEARFEQPRWLPGLLLRWLGGVKVEQYGAAEALAGIEDPDEMQALYDEPARRAAVLG